MIKRGAEKERENTQQYFECKMNLGKCSRGWMRISGDPLMICFAAADEVRGRQERQADWQESLGRGTDVCMSAGEDECESSS